MKLETIATGINGTITLSKIFLDPLYPEEENLFLSNFLNSINSHQTSIVSEETQQSALSLAPAISNQIVLSKLICQYISHKESEGTWSEKTRVENEAPLNLLLEIVGDIAVSAINHNTANMFHDTLRKIPTNRKKLPEFKDLTIPELIALNLPREKLQSNTTINKIMGRVVACFNYSVKRGYSNNNYFKDYTLKTPTTAREQRQQFSSLDLTKLFSHKVFSNPEDYSPFKYWLPILGLYTGARLNELCQLHIDDIYEKDGVWVIDINASKADKKLKNGPSKRLIPIHSQLIKFGFLKHVSLRKRLYEIGACNYPRLWPELNLSSVSKDYTKKASRYFNEKLRVETGVGIGVKTKNFHSYRHSFATAMINALLPEERVAAITGHSAGKTQVLNRYAKGFELQQLKKDIESLQFEDELSTVSNFVSEHEVENIKVGNTHQ